MIDEEARALWGRLHACIKKDSVPWTSGLRTYVDQLLRACREDPRCRNPEARGTPALARMEQIGLVTYTRKPSDHRTTWTATYRGRRFVEYFGFDVEQALLRPGSMA